MIDKAAYIVKSLLKGIGILLLPLTIHGEPFLWKVETDPPSYLFGTVHSADPLVRDLPPVVLESLSDSRTFHPELEFSPEEMGRMAAYLFRMDNPDLEPQLPAELWERLLRNSRRAGIPEMLLQKLPIELAALPFSSPPGIDFNQVIDVQLYRLALEADIEVHALETFEEQVAAFRSLDRDMAISFLEQALDEFESGFPTMQEILRLYRTGDLSRLEERMQSEFDELPDGEKLAKVLLVDRNRLMVERALPYLENGGAFVAVGVGHFTGDHNLLDLLAEEGFSIERIGGNDD